MAQFVIHRYIGPHDTKGKLLWEGESQQDMINYMYVLHKEGWVVVNGTYYWRNKPGTFRGYLDAAESQEEYDNKQKDGI